MEYPQTINNPNSKQTIYTEQATIPTKPTQHPTPQIIQHNIQQHKTPSAKRTPNHQNTQSTQNNSNQTKHLKHTKQKPPNILNNKNSVLYQPLTQQIQPVYPQSKPKSTNQSANQHETPLKNHQTQNSHPKQNQNTPYLATKPALNQQIKYKTTQIQITTSTKILNNTNKTTKPNNKQSKTQHTQTKATATHPTC